MGADYHHGKHFSLEEAQAALAQVRPKVTRIVELKHKLDKLGYNVYQRAYPFGFYPNGHTAHPPAFEELSALIKALYERGILIKDLDEGILDFPARRPNGEEVYLCWKLGEEDIAHWHGLKAGFAGRRPLSEW